MSTQSRDWSGQPRRVAVDRISRLPLTATPHSSLALTLMDEDSLSEGEKEDLELYANHSFADSPYWKEVVATTRRARSDIRETLQQVRQQRQERRPSPSLDVDRQVSLFVLT